MKNSEFYAKKIKHLVSRRQRVVPDKNPDRIALLVVGILSEDVTPKQASSAFSVLREEFIDFNELRVSPLGDIVGVLDEDFSGARAKAKALINALQSVFDRANALSLDFLAKEAKRDVRATLREKMGLSPYAESVVTLYGFGGHAMPVDDLLMEALKLDEYIHPDSDLLDLQGFLERITPGKDAISYHEAFRKYTATVFGRVAKERARRQKQAEAEAKAKAEAEAKVRAKAEARAKARAKAKAKAKAKTKAKPKARAKAAAVGRKKPSRKPAAAKSTKKKTRRKTVKKKAASRRGRK